MSIVQGFAPVGPMELELATTIANLFWRLRRIPVFEASASCPPVNALPPDPSDVEPKSTLTLQPPPASAPAEAHLAYLRDQIRFQENRRVTHTEALARLASPRECRSKSAAECPFDHAQALTQAAGKILDWPVMELSLWKDVAAQIGFEVSPDAMPRWTFPWLMRAFDHLAQQTGCKRSAFRRKVCNNLSSQIARIDSRLLKMREQEATLENQMRSDRDHATAVTVFSTQNAVAKIQHAENHLNRQLERSLAMLERLQSNRRSDPPCRTTCRIDPAIRSRRR